MKQHMRPHGGPAQTRASPHCLVYVLHRGYTILHEVNGFPPECGLEPVGNVGGYFLAHPDGNLAHPLVKRFGFLQHAICGPLVTQQLHQGNQVWRVKGMTENKAGRIDPALLKFLNHEPRRR